MKKPILFTPATMPPPGPGRRSRSLNGDACDRNPASPGRLAVIDAEDHTPEFGSYCLEAVDNQHEIVAKVFTCCGMERANAERLALCWNSHDALLAACKALVSLLEDLHGDSLSSGTVDAARAAIALATKGAA